MSDWSGLWAEGEARLPLLPVLRLAAELRPRSRARKLRSFGVLLT